MARCLISLPALALCLSLAIHTQEDLLPRPSIYAKPGPYIPRGENVTIVCQGAAGFEEFRLQKGRPSEYRVEKNTSPSETEARFLLTAVGEDTAGDYHCIYRRSGWSEYSENLKLVVTGAGVTQATTPVSVLCSDFTSPKSTQTPGDGFAAPGLKAEHLSVLTGVSVGFLLLLLLLFLFCLYCRRQNKHRPPSSKDQEQRTRERLGPAVDDPERAADQAAADRPLQQGGEQGTSTLLQGPQEVTYAQLDHRALTQRGPQAVSSQSVRPMAESSTYAVLARH